MAPHDASQRVGPRVRNEHRSIMRRCAALRARVENGDQDHVVRDWEELASDLGAHLGFEEHDLFPLLAFEAPNGPRLVARLHADHAEIRRRVGAITASVTNGGLDIGLLEALAELVQRHGALEEQRLYPWAIAREMNPDLV